MGTTTGTSSPWGDGPEMPLEGGDVTEGIVRVGGTVRRPMGGHSPLVHAVLAHLAEVGFDGAPRLLGIDEHGREVLTFVDGEVAGRPWPAWVADEDRVVSVARLVRAYDDAVAPLGLPMDLVAPPPDVPGIPPPPRHEPTLIGHVDVTPENVVFRDGAAVALIDFDLARPATRMDEVYSVMLWWAPLGPPRDRAPVLADVDPVRRCRVIADAYGLSADDRDHMVDVALVRTARSWHLMRHAATHQGGGWARMWADGAGERMVRRMRWMEEQADAIRDALTA